MCKCDNWHDILIWVNFGLALDMMIFGVFAFLTLGAFKFNSGFFLQLIFPVYYL